jgi:hypothetical protein
MDTVLAICRRDGAFVTTAGDAHTGTRGDLAALNRDHDPDPVHIDDPEAQRLLLSLVKRRVAELVPGAVAMTLDLNLDTSGQYGFLVTEVLDADGRALTTAEGLLQEVELYELYDLNWAGRGGVVGENDDGSATVRLMD